MTAGERMIDCPGRSAGAVSEELIRAGESAGYTVGATGPGTFRLVKSVRPQWALILAILFAPLFGLGLLFLRVRRTTESVVTVFEDRRGLHARVVGPLEDSIVALLGRSPVTDLSDPPTPPSEMPGSAPPAEPPTVPESVSPPVSRDDAPSPSSSPPAPPPQSTPGLIGSPFAPEPHETLVRDSGAAVNDLDRTVVRPGRVGAAAAGGNIVVVLPSGERVPLAGRSVLGRDPNTAAGEEAIVVKDPSLSRSHLALEPGNGLVTVTDLQSMNGTVVHNGRDAATCEPGVTVVVQPPARIVAGEVDLSLEARP